MFPGETIVRSMWKEGGHVLLQVKVKERDTPALMNAAITLKGRRGSASTDEVCGESRANKARLSCNKYHRSRDSREALPQTVE